MRKFSDTIDELVEIAFLDKANEADPLTLSHHLVHWVSENWLRGKFPILGRLNGEGMLEVIRPDPFFIFFMEVLGTKVVWRISYQPEGRRSPRGAFWSDLAIDDDTSSQLRDAIRGGLSPADTPQTSAGEHAGTAAPAPSAAEHPSPSSSDENPQPGPLHEAAPPVEAVKKPNQLPTSPPDANHRKRQERTRTKQKMYGDWRNIAHSYRRNQDGTSRTRRQISLKVADDPMAADPITEKKPAAASVMRRLDEFYPGWANKK